jgi:hypothetical protein
VAEELETYYILIPSDKHKLFLNFAEQRGWHIRDVLPGEYFPPEEAFERPHRKRKPKPDSDERKVEE